MPRRKAEEIVDPVIPSVDVQIPRPSVDILERGLENVFGLPTVEIKLKDADLQCHWVNTAIRDNRITEMRESGYLPVRPEYLLDPEAFYFVTTPDGYVARGTRMEERLWYSTKDNVKRRAFEKARINRERMNPHVTKQEVVQAASAKLGDEAADFLHKRTGPVGGVSDSYERIERQPGFEED